MNQTIIQPLFWAGDVYMTPGAADALAEAGLKPFPFLTRHLTGDWGDLCAEDRAANEAALRYGYRLFSSYIVSDDLKLWLITEADRSSTTILLPSEY